jgi:L-amino acid N-acyltransferase YncA
MTKSQLRIRGAIIEDAAEIAAIYNEGSDEGSATFNTNHVATTEMQEKITKGGDKHPIFVAASTELNNIAGLASISTYSNRACYSGIGEISIYVHKAHRRQGIGKASFRR